MRRISTELLKAKNHVLAIMIKQFHLGSILLVIIVSSFLIGYNQEHAYAQSDDEVKKSQLQRCELLYNEYLQIGETKFIERYMHFRDDRNCVKLYQDHLWNSQNEDRNELLILLLYEIDGDSKTLKERSVQNLYQISDWMKKDAKRWYQGLSSDSKFAFVLRTLVESKIIQADIQGVFVIPKWVKQTTQWWVEGKISDRDYIVSLQYLMQKKIVTV